MGPNHCKYIKVEIGISSRCASRTQSLSETGCLFKYLSAVTGQIHHETEGRRLQKCFRLSPNIHLSRTVFEAQNFQEDFNSSHGKMVKVESEQHSCMGL